MTIKSWLIGWIVIPKRVCELLSKGPTVWFGKVDPEPLPLIVPPGIETVPLKQPP